MSKNEQEEKKQTIPESVEDALKHSMVKSFIQYVEGGSR